MIRGVFEREQAQPRNGHVNGLLDSGSEDTGIPANSLTLVDSHHSMVFVDRHPSPYPIMDIKTV